MAQLSSPGVSVTVVDESFYTPPAPGTVPLIVVASQANKMNSAGTGIAAGTLASNAGKVYLLTSQMDLGNTFGIPYFQTDAENNPVNAGELNEYGLQAAYSFLGVSNQAYVVRADLDTSQLVGSALAPSGAPADGTYWFDTAVTNFGIFQWNSAPATTTGGQIFSSESHSVITNAALTTGGGTPQPLASYGAIGDYAIVATTTLNTLWLKKYQTSSAAGTWVQVGSPSWVAAWPTVTAPNTTPGLTSADSLTITTTWNSSTNAVAIPNATTLSALATNINTAFNAVMNQNAIVTAAVINGYLVIYSSGASLTFTNTGGTGAALSKLGLTSSIYLAPALTIAPHYSVPLYKITDQTGSANGYPTGSIWVKTTPVNQGAAWNIQKYNGSTSSWIKQTVNQLYPNNQSALAALDPTGGGINLPVGQVYVKYNDDEATPAYANFKIYGRSATGALNVTSAIITSSTFTASTTYSFTLTASQIGSATLPAPVTVSFTLGSTVTAASAASAFMTAFTAAVVDPNVSAVLNANNSVTITHAAGGDLRFVETSGSPIFSTLFPLATTANFGVDPSGTSNHYLASLWTATVGGSAFAVPSPTAPTTVPADGTLWYNTVIDQVDILVNNGSAWVGYLNYTQNQAGGPTTDPMGPIISATQPTTQSDGTALANGDLWIDTSNLEEYPMISKYNYTTKKWELIDNTDHTTEHGIIFADARWNDNASLTGTQSGTGAADSIASLLSSNFVDFDAPSPVLYPKGMLLWNLRRSGNNVLRYVEGYINTNAYNLNIDGPSGELMASYYPDRWVSDAPNTVKGVGEFGRKAQRAIVVKALNALIESNQQIRDEDSRVFNLMSCPGYLETTAALVDLNTSRGLLSFIVTDAPARLTPDATSLSNWGNNTAGAAIDGEDGLIITSSDVAVYYPWAMTTDLLGNEIVVPPSHVMLRTIALSDNVSYPWFAPAGTRRGGVTNASSVGYVDGQTGEYTTVALNGGQRDTLASIHVNPITYIGGVGLVAYGQYTRQLVASSLDRINVARLVIYLRYQLNRIAKPYIFEPNDTITRNEIKQQIESMLLELTGQRALYDYIVVCDTSNNTPSRIDANELYVDIAIEPVKSVEFIYIPLRLENTGAIKGLGK